MTQMPTTLDTVLVTSSLAKAGTPVVCQALALAKAGGADAVLAHALHPTAADGVGPEDLAPGADSEESAALEELQAQAAGCPERPHSLEHRVVVGVAHRAIARLADESAADLVVVGAQEDDTLTKKLLGSTADRLARRCRAPVLVVRGALEPRPGRLLLPVDLSSCSVRSLQHALVLLEALAPSEGIAGTLLYVLGPKEQLLYPGDPTQTRDRLDRELRLLSARVLARGSAMHLEVRVAEGDPCRVILKQAEYEGTDWIVLGSHGRGGFERFLMGSVASEVVRHSPISVLVVPPVGSAENTA